MTKTILSLLILALVAACGKDPEVTRDPALEAQQANRDYMLKLVNEARASGYLCGEDQMPAVAPLKWNALLEKSSAAYAQYMTEEKFFAHEGKDGTKPSDRISKAGYRWSLCGENIAKGQTSIKEVVAGWLKSPGHCVNIMREGFTELGAARFENTWVQNFGHP